MQFSAVCGFLPSYWTSLTLIDVTVGPSFTGPAILRKRCYLCSMADRELFIELFEPIQHAVTQYVRVMVGNYEDSRDIVADTVLAALERMEEVTNPESFKFFMFAIARRTYWRSVLRRRLFIPLEKKHENLSLDGEAIALVSLDVNLLMDAIHELPAKQREAISLFEFGGFSIEEIRNIQGGSLSGVKTRLSRAREKLKSALSEPKASQIISADFEKPENPGGDILS
jgi:RNA polymerase sigma factor (sigma-70 family)